MKKIFKNLYVVLFALLAFMPTIKAIEDDEFEVEEEVVVDELAVDDIYIELDYDKQLFVAGTTPTFFASSDSEKYEITLEKICEKDSEICVTSSDSLNDELSKKGNLLDKYVAGKTYVYNLELTATEGYSFSEDLDSLGAYYNDDYKLTVTPNVLKIDEYFVSTALKPIEKAEVTDATLMFKVGDKVKFTAKSNSDLFTVYNEAWSSYSAEEGNEKVNNSNKKMDEYLIDEEIFDVFENREYYYSIILAPSEGYTFTNDTVVTINGTKLRGYAYDGYVEHSYHASRSLDLTDKTIEEKNNNSVLTGILYTLYSYDTLKTGITKELYDEMNEADPEDISIDFVVTEITDENAKKELDNANKELLKNANVVSYLDLSIPVTIKGEIKGYVTDLISPINVTLKLPNNLPLVSNNALRQYYVISIHNDKSKVVSAFDNGDGTIAFAADGFSDYAIAYVDVVNPETADNIVLHLMSLVMSLAGLIALNIFIYKE